jgi:hypothetical protein
MIDFYKDKAFISLLLIGLFGIVGWDILGHFLGIFGDQITTVFGPDAYEDGFRMAHLHGLSNALALPAGALAMPLITSIKPVHKYRLALVLGLTVVLWNFTYLFAGLTTAAPTSDAFAASKTAWLTFFGVPVSMVASAVGVILLSALVYDLYKRRKSNTT